MKQNPLYSELIREIERETAKCARCGACQGVCPVFRVVQREQAVARGKIALADAFLRRDVDATRNLEKIAQNCVLCLACKESCPNNVDTALVIKNLRIILGVSGTRLSGKEVLGRMFKNPGLLKASLKFDTLVSHSRLNHLVPRQSGLRQRFPVSLLLDERLSCEQDRSGNRDLHVVYSPCATKSCLFFTGCTTRYLRPKIAHAAIDLMSALGYKVITPDEQQCCGFAASVSGQVDTERYLEERLRELVTKHSADFILTVCPTCNERIREVIGKLDMNLPVHDISKFAAKYAEIRSRQAPGHGKITVSYHESCHLSRALKIREEPRRALRARFGAGFIEMEDANKCCGLGGLYGVTHPTISRAILDEKIQRVRETGCDLLFTACPACVLQLEYGVKRAGLKVRVAHLAELTRFYR